MAYPFPNLGIGFMNRAALRSTGCVMSGGVNVHTALFAISIGAVLNALAPTLLTQVQALGFTVSLHPIWV